MGDIRITGQGVGRDGMYLCLNGCGTMVKASKGDTLPICYYCLERVRWRRLGNGGVLRKVALMPEAKVSSG